MTRLLRRELAAERERWVLWLPVALALGIGLYFLLPVEPWPWLGAVGLLVVVAATATLRHHPGTLIVGLAAATVAAGFTVAQLRTALVAAPILGQRHGPALVSGLVIESAARSGAGRIVLEAPRISGLPAERTPAKIRIRLTRNETLLPAVGSRVQVKAILRPPPPPAAPGAFDFGRQAFYARLGAVGFAVGRLELSEPTSTADGTAASAWSLWWAERRQAVGQRIMAALPGPAGAVALALMTGDRSALPEGVTQDMRDSGLAHLLAISGLHMGLLVGLIFFLARALLALSPTLALRFPIKKWAALASALGGFAYLHMAGASIPTQRAFIMACIVLLAVLLDRTAISLRLVAWAAAAVLLVAPESLLSASFQMSFAAVTALVAAYETLGRPLAGDGGRSRLLLYLIGVVLSSVIAIVATAPFALYHFNRLASYGLAANLVAVPLTAFWVMPWALLAFLLMPFGLEGLALEPMGWGTAAIIAVAHEIARWPGAVVLVKAMPPAGLVAMALGGLWLCLWLRPWRLAGLTAVAAGVVVLALARPPDILVSEDAKLLGLRDEGGRLWLSSDRAGRFAAETWLRRAGQGAGHSWPLDDADTDSPLLCDALGCVAETSGLQVAFALEGGALAEDCRRATLLVSLEPLRWRSCPGPRLVIDRFDLWRHGAHAVWLNGGKPVVRTVAQGRQGRPWGARPEADSD